jgi:hypothetical protein
MDNKGKIKPVSLDKTLSDFPKYDENPFMRQLLYMRNTRNKIVAAGKVFDVQDPETGEVSDTQTMRSWVVERVDKDEFTKIYDKYLQVVFGLSPRALKLFQYFLTALKFNDERVFFDAKEATKVTGYTSKQTIVTALTELVDAEIIARSPAPNIYYINPKVFVKGNRIDMIQTWVKKNTPEDRALAEQMKERDEKRKQLELFNERHPVGQAAIGQE